MGFKSLFPSFFKSLSRKDLLSGNWRGKRYIASLICPIQYPSRVVLLSLVGLPIISGLNLTVSLTPWSHSHGMIL